MATKATTIWSLAVVKSHVKATGTALDTQIARLADGVSSRIEEFLGRKVVSQSVTEVLSLDSCSQKISLQTYPISAVAELKYRWTMLNDWTALAASDYEIDAARGWIFSLFRSFPEGDRTVSVTYTAGWDAQDGVLIPSDIYTLGLDFVKYVYDRWNNDLGAVSSVSAGQRNATLLKDIPDDVKQALERHRKRRI
jgi:hypothetical protein